jgi:hypothetical protein
VSGYYDPNNNQELYRRAEKRVKQKLEFYQHLTSYIVVNLFLIGIWFFTGMGYPWFIWVILGWGIGIVSHGVSLFGFNRVNEQALIEQEMRKMGATPPPAGSTPYYPPVNTEETRRE